MKSVELEMGVSGIAIGTVISGIVASIVNIYKLIDKNKLKLEHLANLPDFKFVKTYVSRSMAISARLIIILSITFLIIHDY